MKKKKNLTFSQMRKTKDLETDYMFSDVDEDGGSNQFISNYSYNDIIRIMTNPSTLRYESPPSKINIKNSETGEYFHLTSSLNGSTWIIEYEYGKEKNVRPFEKNRLVVSKNTTAMKKVENLLKKYNKKINKKK